jgi:serine/threonine protein kinase
MTLSIANTKLYYLYGEYHEKTGDLAYSADKFERQIHRRGIVEPFRTFLYYIGWSLEKAEKHTKQNKEKYSYDLKHHSLLGFGACCKVFKGTLLENNTSVAIKTLKYKRYEYCNDLLVEATYLQRLPTNPYFPKFYDLTIGEEPFSMNLFMEYVGNTTLHEQITNDAISLKDILTIVHQLCQALELLDKHNLSHLDIKPTNLLWNKEDQTLRVFDLGNAYDLDDTAFMDRKFSCQALCYRSPEILLYCPLLKSNTDVWSAGCVIYEILTQRRLFLDQQRPESPHNKYILIHSMTALLGFPPNETIESGSKSNIYFDRATGPLRLRRHYANSITSGTIEEKIEKLVGNKFTTPEEKAIVNKITRIITTFVSYDRPSPKEALAFVERIIDGDISEDAS